MQVQGERMTQSISFPGAIGGRIVCRSDPMNGIEVLVNLSGVQVGAVFILSWQGFRDSELTQPVPGTQISLARHFVEQSDIDGGLTRRIGEWLEHIKPIRNGWGKAYYTINGGNEVIASIQVQLLNAAGQSCDEVA
jgi:hypothetical protein